MKYSRTARLKFDRHPRSGFVEFISFSFVTYVLIILHTTDFRSSICSSSTEERGEHYLCQNMEYVLRELGSNPYSGNLTSLSYAVR